MRPFAIIFSGAWLLLASAATAQTAGDAAMAVAATQDAEKEMAGQARHVTKSAITAVFGGGTAPAAPAPAGQPAAAAPAAGGANAKAWDAMDAQAGGPAAGEIPGEGQAPPADTALGDGRRDPFRPFTLDLQHAETQEDEPQSPLQRYEIAQLKLTGLVLEMRPPRAMLQDNSGMGYIVTPGTPIGRRHGVVKSIEPGRLVVEEIVLDYYGRQQPHQVVVEMPKDDKKAEGGEKP
jgi:type IV pilus assembly protein PilP